MFINSSNKYGLTKREYEIFILILRGNSYKNIAEKLFVSTTTVKTHMVGIYYKLFVH